MEETAALKNGQNKKETTDIKTAMLDFAMKNNTLIVFIVMMVIASIASPVFFTQLNILNLLRQVSPLGIGAMGMLLVILTGGIDLSIGSVMAFSSVVFATFLMGLPLVPAILLALFTGIVLGGINGYFVARKNVAAFVVTLAMMTMARGWAMLVSKGSPVQIDNDFLSEFGAGSILGLPYPIIVMFIVFLVSVFILRKTTFGRLTTAIGSNETAVRLAGIQVANYKHLVYIIAGFMFALAGVLATSRSMVGSPILAAGFELDTIAAVVIGGASLSGGKGTAFNTLLGVFILGIISNLMNLMNVPGYNQQVVKGVIILAAVLLQGYKKNKR